IGMSESAERTISSQLTLFAGGSPASRSARQAEDEARKTTASSGRKCCASYLRCSRASSWLKTFLGCCLSSRAFYSTAFSLTWKLQATKSRHRWYFRLRHSARRISGTECSLWRTPNSKVIEPKSSVLKLAGRTPQDPQVGQADQVMAAERAMWPTPRANDWKGGLRHDTKSQRAECDFFLPDQVNAVEGMTGQLNAEFVEWLMGLPQGWTDIGERESGLECRE
ncbi:MAG TPA: hypothetical protein VM537_25410, partial [Anaerolineae bacterium]|nr:hypothetical protein [Anaerolineae bacterium]